MYVDESGGGESSTVLAGVIIHSNDYLSSSRKIDNLVGDIFGLKSLNLKNIRRKNYQEKKFPEFSYNVFNSEYYEALKDINPTFIACIVEDSYQNITILKIKSAYKVILEMFQYFLQEKYEVGEIKYHKGSLSKNIFEQHKKISQEGSEFVKRFNRINNIYESADDCRLIQMADLLANGLSNYFNRKSLYHFEHCLHFFRESPSGLVEGWGIKILK